MTYRIRMIAAACAAGLALTEAAQASITPSHDAGATHNCAQHYPALSERLNESGTVQIGYDVQADGTIVNVTMLQSSGSERLDRAAVQCVSKSWRNTPALRDGVPVRSLGYVANIRFVMASANPDTAASRTALALPPQATARTAPNATADDEDTGDVDALDFVLRYGGAIAIVILLTMVFRRWIFRARTCPSCAARNRGIVPFMLPTYCSSCGVKFDRPAATPSV